MAYEYVKEFENRVPSQAYVSEAMHSELPLLEQSKPLTARDLNAAFRADYEQALHNYMGRRMDVRGTVIFKGLDIHGIPSFELSDRKDGVCYILCCLRSEREYGDLEPGQLAVLRGNYLTVHEKYGVVLKNCVIWRDDK